MSVHWCLINVAAIPRQSCQSERCRLCILNNSLYTQWPPVCTCLYISNFSLKYFVVVNRTTPSYRHHMNWLDSFYLLGVRFIHSFWPSDAIWWHRSGSTLAQLMACCLTAHYHEKVWIYQSVKPDWKLHFINYSQVSQGQLVNYRGLAWYKSSSILRSS